MSQPDRKRSRIFLVLRWLVTGVCGLVSAVAVVAFVVANTDLAYTFMSGPNLPESPRRSYRYAVFGVSIAKGNSLEGVNVEAEYSRCQSFHVCGTILLGVAVGLLVGGLVFFLWRPIFMSRRC